MSQPLWWGLSVVVSCGAMIGYWLIARRQVSRATANLRSELRHERLIVAQVSHRLRDALTVIYGFSETLVDTTLRNDKDEIVHVASAVNAAALDVSRTVEDLVAAQEVDTGNLQVRSVGFDPREEIGRVVTPFRRLGSPISVEAWSGTAISDPIRFRHVIQSIVSNAVRYGGSEISIYADLDDDWYRCTIADDGAGLSDEMNTRLFGVHDGHSPSNPDDHADGDDAESVDRNLRIPSPPLVVDIGQADGLGLGIAVAMRIAQGLGGSLTYDRAEDFTAFTLSLPTNDWPGPLVPMEPPASPVPDPGPDDETPEDEEIGHGLHLPTVAFDDADGAGEGNTVDDSEAESSVEDGDRGVITS